MGSFQITNLKLEKANAITKHRRLRRMATLFRMIEICVILVLVSRFTSQLPISVNFKDLTGFLVSARFVFILGNVIAAILYAKSRQFPSQDSAKKAPGNDFYTDFAQKSEKTAKSGLFSSQDCAKKDSASGNNFYPEFVKKSEQTQSIIRYESDYRAEFLSNEAYTSSKSKSHRRSQSENSKLVNCEKPFRELRRAETEKFKKSTNSGERSVKTSFLEEEMSNDEFRRTIDAFIARQQKFRVEEEYSVI